jgi:hypothetical protein
MDDRSQGTGIQSVLAGHRGYSRAVLPESRLDQRDGVPGREAVLPQGCSTLELCGYARQADNLLPQQAGVDCQGATLKEGCAGRVVGRRFIRPDEGILAFPLRRSAIDFGQKSEPCPPLGSLPLEFG